jgi:hypothetical protein
MPQPPSLASLFIFSSHEGVSLHCTPVELSIGQPLLQAFPSPRLLGGCRPPAFSGRLVYLQFVWGMPLPHTPELRGPHPLCYMSFFFLAACLLFNLVCFPLFSLGGDQSPGVMLICSRVVCGSTICHLAQLVSASPKQDRSWSLAA